MGLLCGAVPNRAPFPALAKSRMVGAVPNGRIQQPGSRRRPLAALTRSRWMAPPSVIAALQTFEPQPTEPEPDRGSFPLAGRTATSCARNLLRDWQAPDSAAPAADNIRRIWPTRCFWPTARISPPERDNAAPPLCDQPSPACKRVSRAELARRIGNGSRRLVDKCAAKHRLRRAIARRCGPRPALHRAARCWQPIAHARLRPLDFGERDARREFSWRTKIADRRMSRSDAGSARRRD